MIQQVFQEGDSGMVIHASKTNVFVKAFLWLLFLVCVFAICASITFMVIGGDGFQIGYVFSLVIFGLFAWYTLRLALWNSFGKEFIMFEKDKVTYTADYRAFQENKQQLPIDKDLTIEIQDFKEDGTVYLKFQHLSEKIETVILVPKGQFKSFGWERMAHLYVYAIKPQDSK